MHIENSILHMSLVFLITMDFSLFHILSLKIISVKAFITFLKEVIIWLHQWTQKQQETNIKCAKFTALLWWLSLSWTKSWKIYFLIWEPFVMTARSSQANVTPGLTVIVLWHGFIIRIVFKCKNIYFHWTDRPAQTF